MRPRRAAPTLTSTLASIAAASTLAVFAAPAGAQAEPRNDADRVGGAVYDVCVLRPASLLKTVFGAVFLVPSYPLSLGSAQRSRIVEILVTDPAKDTFTRPIGDF